MAEADRDRLARYYDLDLATEQPDLDLYLALARATEGPVLELAAGSGRISVPLAAAGHEVTAVDVDPQMLERARGRWSETARQPASGSLELVEGDITDLDLGRRYGLVILALNTLLLLPGREAQRSALATMARQLADDGRAVVDVWVPGPDDLALYDGRLLLEWQRTDPETGEEVAKTWAGTYDAAHATARLTTYFDAWRPPSGSLTRVAREDRFSLLGASELLALVEAAGLHPSVTGGDYALTPFGTGSERMILVCGLL